MDEESFGRTFEAVAGSISVNWNRLEREMDQMTFEYSRESADVFARILAAVGNMTKGDLLKYMASKRERSRLLREHIAHFITAFNVLRENRNILEHAVPHRGRDGKYQDRIFKIGRDGRYQEFAATLEDLETLENDIKRIGGYGKLLIAAVQDVRAGRRKAIERIIPALKSKTRSFRAVVASLEKPALPRKLNPRQPETVQPASPRRRRSSRK